MNNLDFATRYSRAPIFDALIKYGPEVWPSAGMRFLLHRCIEKESTVGLKMICDLLEFDKIVINLAEPWGGMLPLLVLGTYFTSQDGGSQMSRLRINACASPDMCGEFFNAPSQKSRTPLPIPAKYSHPSS
jgi:hypothetical protein